MKKLLALATLIGLTLWACHLGPEEKSDSFDIVADTAWTRCDTLEVLLLDDSGMVLDTLFRDSLKSVSQLQDLDAGKYPGGNGRIRIKGFYRDGSLCVDQTRSFEAGGTKVKVDTLVDPSADPASVVADPEFLSLVADGGAQKVKGKVLPSYVDQGLYWSMDSSGVASLDLAADAAASEATVKPEALGEGHLILRSRKDGSKFARVRVRVSPSAAVSVSLDDDSLMLYANGPAEVLLAVVLPFLADQSVAWSSGDTAVVRVDTAGRLVPGKEGRTVVRAVTGNGKHDSAVVVVVRDIPLLTVASKTGAPLNEPIVYSPSATQKVGHLVLYAWDLNGDGAWDDSLTGPWHGDSVNLPAVTAKYPAEGPVTARFRVRDSEGNTAIAEAGVYIGNQAPEILALRGDTVISIRDSIAMTATARDLDGKVAWAGWDFEGDGQFDDTLVTLDAQVEVAVGHRYLEAGNYLAVFRAVDSQGKVRQDTARIRVEFDAPVADAGEDTTVIVNGDITLHVRGGDGFGTIAKREFKLGDGPFLPVTALDTVLQAPAEPMVLEYVIRLTDDDGLSGLDTVKVTVVLSANSDLIGLTLSAGSLVPAFKPEIGVYGAQVGFPDSLVQVTPTSRDPAAELTVNGRPIASGSASEPVKLQVGANAGVFQIRVASPDGSARTYAVSVSRSPNAEASLKALAGTGFALKPAFAANVLDYLDTVAAAVPSITLRPTVASLGATVAVNDSGVASGTPTVPLPLKYGANHFRVTVTAMDGASKTTYNVRVVRRAKLYIYRKLGSAAAVLADSAEFPPGAPRPLSSPGSTGHTFARWSLLEGSATLADSGANPTTITLVSGLVKSQATFTLNRYTITGTVAGCGSLNPAPGAAAYNHGSTVNYTLTPSAGCRIRSVRIDGVEDASAYDGTYTFTNLTASHALAAVFSRGFPLEASVTLGAGTIKPDFIDADTGSTHTFVFKPAANYRYLDLLDNGVAASPVVGDTQYTLTAVKAAHDLRVRFRRLFTFSVASRGCGSVSPGGGTVDSASSRTFTLTPLAGCKVDSVFVNNVSVSPNATQAINGIAQNTALRVVFTRTFTIATTWGTSGNNHAGGSIAPANPSVDSLDGQTLTIGVNIGYRRLSLTANGTAVTPVPATYTFTNVTANRTLQAVFLRTFNQTSSVSLGAGTITPALATVDTLGSQLFSFSPAANYRFHSLLVNGTAVTPTGGTTQHNLAGINRDNAVQARFWRQYNIAVSSSGCGTVPAGGAADSASNRNFAFTLPAGCSVDSLIVDGARVAPAASHAFNNILANHVLRVVFSQGYTVATTWGTSGNNQVGGSISPANPGVLSGQPVTLAINVSAGYRRLAFAVNGTQVTPVPASHTIPSVTSNLTAHATFLRTFNQTGIVGLGAGTITPASQTIDTAASQLFNFSPAANYRFHSLLVNGTAVTPTGGTTQHNLSAVTRDNQVAVRFWRLYTITTSYTGCGSVPAGGARDSASNNPFAFTIPANCKVDSLFIDGTATAPANSHAFNSLARNHTLRAVFVRSFTVATTWATTGTAGAGGSVSPNNPVVDSLDPVTVNILPAAGYRRYSMLVNNSPVPVAATYTFSPITANQAFHAEFWRVFRVTGMAVPGGSVTPAQSDIDSAGIANLTITPTPGYAIDTVWDNHVVQIVDGGAAAIAYAIRGIKADHQVVASFKRSYSFKVTVQGEGSADPKGGSVGEGEDRVIKFQAGPGNALVQLLDNGKDVTPRLEGDPAGQSSYSLHDVGETHDIEARFAGYRLRLSDTIVLRKGEAVEKPTELCVEWDGAAGNGRQCGPDLDLNIPAGSKVRIAAPPAVMVCIVGAVCNERRFDYWYAQTSQAGEQVPDNPYSFDMKSDYVYRAVYGNSIIIGPPIEIDTPIPIGFESQSDR